MGRKKAAITLMDIAQDLGISKNAVSLGLSGKPGISLALRERIMASALRLGYQAPGRSETTALNFLVLFAAQLLADDAHFGAILSGIEQGVSEAGHRVMLAALDPRAGSAMPAVHGAFPWAGFLVLGGLPPALERQLLHSGVPVQQLEGASLDIPVIASDGFVAGYALTEHLVAQGRRNLAWLGPLSSDELAFACWSGYRRSLACRGMSDNDFLDAAALGKDSLPASPFGMVCASEELAIQAAGILAKRGYRIPEDAAIAVCGDGPLARFHQPPLTAYSLPRQELGRLAVSRLLAALAGGAPVNQAATRTLVAGELQVRASSVRGQD